MVPKGVKKSNFRRLNGLVVIPLDCSLTVFIQTVLGTTITIFNEISPVR